MRILITGGFGYIGARLASFLQNVGHDIFIGTRNTKDSPSWAHQITLVQIDWNNSKSLEKNCKEIDIVIHAAGMNAQDCYANPVKAFEFNGLATARLVSAAGKAGVKRFIYLSTAHVYSAPLIGSISEETCLRNLHPYSTSHLAGENAVRYANQCGDIEGIVLRLSNAFGPPMDMNANCWMLLVNDLCRQVVLTKKISLHTSGIQQRDFISITNICRAIAHIISLQKTGLLEDLYNVGGDYSTSVLNMANNIVRLAKVELGFSPEIERPELKQNDKIRDLHFDISKLKSTGFVLKPNFDDEITNTLRMIINNAELYSDKLS